MILPKEIAISRTYERLLNHDNRYRAMGSKLKKCLACGLDKPLKDFGIDRRRSDGHNQRCKTCNRELMRNYIKRDPERVKLRQKEWKLNNPIRAWASSCIAHHKERYKVKFDSAWLTELAKTVNRCPICGTPLYYDRYNGYSKKNTPSLDRITNFDVLTKDNVMIICYNCNRAKSDRTLIEFVEYCKTVVDRYEYLQDKEDITFKL